MEILIYNLSVKMSQPNLNSLFRGITLVTYLFLRYNTSNER